MGDRLERRPEAIRSMFARVAPRYDLLNRLLSVRSDVRWRRRLAAAVRQAPPGQVLDLATGTGDVALALGRAAMGADFCLDMLAIARAKSRAAARALPLVSGDALALPFRSSSFAAVTVAFGVRNFADLAVGVREIHRVLVPGGLLAVLEFQRPPSRLVACFSSAWNRAVVTPIGRLISSDGDAYAYLPASVETFPDARGLSQRLVSCGFSPVSVENLSFGIAALTVVRREEAA